MVDLAPRISADPAVCHGKPVIKGTRVLVSVLVGQVGAGVQVDEIAREYRVQKDDVLADRRQSEVRSQTPGAIRPAS